MHQIKRIDIGSVALYSFLMLLLLGLIIFLPIGLIFSIVSSFVPHSDEFGPFIMPFFSGIFIFLIPLFYAIAGTITNVIIVAVYNLLSVKFGGIKVDLEKIV